MHKKLVILSVLMSIAQITIGGLMSGEILNRINQAKFISIYWIITGVLTLMMALKTYCSMKVNLVHRLFWTLTLFTTGLLASCWINPLSAVALGFYIPIVFLYSCGIIITRKI